MTVNYNHRTWTNVYIRGIVFGYSHTHTLVLTVTEVERQEKYVLIRDQVKSAQGLSFWRESEAEGRSRNSNTEQNAFFFSASGGFQLQSFKTETAPRSQGNLGKGYRSFFFPVNIWYHCSWWMEGNLGTKQTFAPYANALAFMGSLRSARILALPRV